MSWCHILLSMYVCCSLDQVALLSSQAYHHLSPSHAWVSHRIWNSHVTCGDTKRHHTTSRHHKIPFLEMNRKSRLNADMTDYIPYTERPKICHSYRFAGTKHSSSRLMAPQRKVEQFATKVYLSLYRTPFHDRALICNKHTFGILLQTSGGLRD